MSDAIEKPHHDLVKPDFKSAIPPHLLLKATDAERYLVETASRNDQLLAWMSEQIIALHTKVSDHERAIQSVDEWRKMLTGKWAVIFWFITICAPPFLTYVFKLLAK